MRNLILAFCLFVSVLIIPFKLWATPSCADAPQPDGTIWRTCVDDNGITYCESCSNGVCSRVSCSS
ncbi:hypothetical protein K1X76_01340 [bacterium]|nr:hypothetical protein [bacterium]